MSLLCCFLFKNKKNKTNELAFEPLPSPEAVHSGVSLTLAPPVTVPVSPIARWRPTLPKTNSSVPLITSPQAPPIISPPAPCITSPPAPCITSPLAELQPLVKFPQVAKKAPMPTIPNSITLDVIKAN